MLTILHAAVAAVLLCAVRNVDAAAPKPVLDMCTSMDGEAEQCTASSTGVFLLNAKDGMPVVQSQEARPDDEEKFDQGVRGKVKATLKGRWKLFSPNFWISPPIESSPNLVFGQLLGPNRNRGLGSQRRRRIAEGESIQRSYERGMSPTAALQAAAILVPTDCEVGVVDGPTKEKGLSVDSVILKLRCPEDSVREPFSVKIKFDSTIHPGGAVLPRIAASYDADGVLLVILDGLIPDTASIERGPQMFPWHLGPWSAKEIHRIKGKAMNSPDDEFDQVEFHGGVRFKSENGDEFVCPPILPPRGETHRRGQKVMKERDDYRRRNNLSPLREMKERDTRRRKFRMYND